MCPLRLVEDADAGPHAVGLLVPPGRRTVVILRPRALIWDLLLTEECVPLTGSPFRELTQKEATEAARGIYHALEDWFSGGPGGMNTQLNPGGDGYWVDARAGPFTLLACLRVPGQPYRPLHFKCATDAREAAATLATVLFPTADREQEIYINTRHFNQ
jgi:hypothetical protein